MTAQAAAEASQVVVLSVAEDMEAEEMVAAAGVVAEMVVATAAAPPGTEVAVMAQTAR